MRRGKSAARVTIAPEDNSLNMVKSRPKEQDYLRLRIKRLRELAQVLLHEAEILERFSALHPNLKCSSGMEEYGSFYDQMRTIEVEIITRALESCGGSQAKAANLLGLKKTTLNTKIKHYRIDVRAFKIVVSPIIDKRAWSD